MAGRSPARFLAPIALVAVAFALYSVVQDSRDPAGGDSGAPAGATAHARPRPSGSKKKKSSKRKRKTYTVKSGRHPVGHRGEDRTCRSTTLLDAQPRGRPRSPPGQKLKLSR